MSDYLNSLQTYKLALVSTTKLARIKAKYVYGAAIEINSYECREDEDTKLIRGLPSNFVELQPVAPLERDENGHMLSEITVPDNFPPGSFMLFATQLQGFDPLLDTIAKSGVIEAFQDLDLVDLNVLLYRSDAEERDATSGKIGTYHIPNYGNLVYAGLEGWMAPLRIVIENNDLGHPLCDNLRNGSWACEYTYIRLEE